MHAAERKLRGVYRIGQRSATSTATEQPAAEPAAVVLVPYRRARAPTYAVM